MNLRQIRKWRKDALKCQRDDHRSDVKVQLQRYLVLLRFLEDDILLSEGEQETEK